MWTISELKRRGKESFAASRWPLVIISLLFSVISGASARDTIKVNLNDAGLSVKVGGFNVIHADHLSILAPFFMLMFTMTIAAGVVVSIFLLGPLQVGCYRFFIVSIDEAADTEDVLSNFRSGYLNTVTTMFLVNLRIFLWSLLLLIPGIIKCLQFRMVPYLLAEYPDMPPEEAMRISTGMMHGEKWNAFLLDLSFIGWNILSVLTFGLVGLLYAAPYQNMTNAHLYRELCSKQYN